MAEKSTSQSSAGAMRARPLVYQTSSANDGKKSLGYHSRCVLVQVRQSAVEAMDIGVKYGFDGLEVKVIDIRAPVV